MPQKIAIPPNKTAEELEYLFMILEETQAQIMTRLEGLPLQDCHDSKRWKKRLALVNGGSPVKQDL